MTWKLPKELLWVRSNKNRAFRDVGDRCRRQIMLVTCLVFVVYIILFPSLLAKDFTNTYALKFCPIWSGYSDVFELKFWCSVTNIICLQHRWSLMIVTKSNISVNYYEWANNCIFDKQVAVWKLLQYDWPCHTEYIIHLYKTK